MKRTKQISLLLVGAMIATTVTACGKQETRQAHYKTKAECQDDWPDDKGACTGSGTMWHGPSYVFYNGRSYVGGNVRISEPIRATGISTLSRSSAMFGPSTGHVTAGNSAAAVSARSGGFGSSAHASSGGHGSSSGS